MSAEVPVVLWVGDTAAQVGTLTVDPDTWRDSLPTLLRQVADEMDQHAQQRAEHGTGPARDEYWGSEPVRNGAVAEWWRQQPESAGSREEVARG